VFSGGCRRPEFESGVHLAREEEFLVEYAGRDAVVSIKDKTE